MSKPPEDDTEDEMIDAFAKMPTRELVAYGRVLRMSQRCLMNEKARTLNTVHRRLVEAELTRREALTSVSP